MTNIWLRHGRVWHCYEQPHQIIQADTLDQILPALRQIQTVVDRDQLTAVGYISYEASPAFDPALQTHQPHPGLPLLWFGLYPAPTIHDTLPPPPENSVYQLGAWHASQSEAAYADALHQIKQAIARGETYQVNHTFRLTAEFAGDPYALFYALHEAQQAAYSAYLPLGDHLICSVSPELFFRLEGQQVTTLPMKGTAVRGLTFSADQAQSDWLAQSPKNRAENIMIVDMIRNDLSRVAQLGTVRVPHLCQTERYPTLWQMTSTVTATIPPSTSLADLCTALFPCASITGAPKIRTMQLIRQLESSPRGVYCGAIGFYAPHQTAQFSVAIRTIWLDMRPPIPQATYGVGSGIVWDSATGDEYAECQTKAKVLTHRDPPFDLLETLRWEPLPQTAEGAEDAEKNRTRWDLPKGEGGGYVLLERHVQRLAESAAYFGFACDVSLVTAQLEAFACTLPAQAQKVRLVLNRAGQISLTATDLPKAEGTWRVGLAGQPVRRENRFLYHKTTHRQVYEGVWHGRDRALYDDILLWNEQEELTESCIANLALKLGGVWYTPPVSSGLLAGTYRAELLAQGRLQERILTLADLPRAEAIALFNSVRGWMAVREVKSEK
jgi:para-aminobenzoate synthetase / 4-amino-4-deoxychorismate lyase